ncbi:MAG TPA: tRNA pseudouridine(13) synthase TruD [Campylobacterales bacterium]|nr:tRNA pseudouridine(13) synthase TruD [Campylobacterales bacterium]
MDRLFFLDHSPIDFYFKQSPSTFVVEEVLLYPFSNDGEHLVLKVRKKNLTTWQMLKAFSEQLGVKMKEIGYAGLKDKNALAYQYISINKKFEKKLENFSNENIKILETFRHKNKLRIGHLKGNSFFIRLKKVDPIGAKKIENVLEIIKKEGFPNYFGYQRFGIDGKNYLLGKEIIKKKINKKEKFLINSYQSHLFNLWLSKRVEISKFVKSFNKDELKNLLNLSGAYIDELKAQKQFFKLLRGDIACHYPFGKFFAVLDLIDESKRFIKREIAPTGLLPGIKVQRSNDIARDIEKDFDDQDLKISGDRRFAWVFLKDLEIEYKEEKAWMELKFFLPKGSYATVLLEEIAHKSLS